MCPCSSSRETPSAGRASRPARSGSSAPIPVAIVTQADRAVPTRGAGRSAARQSVRRRAGGRADRRRRSSDLRRRAGARALRTGLLARRGARGSRLPRRALRDPGARSAASSPTAPRSRPLGGPLMPFGYFAGLRLGARFYLRGRSRADRRVLAWTRRCSCAPAVRAARRPSPAIPDAFLVGVPRARADEEVTIADSVRRLLAVEARTASGARDRRRLDRRHRGRAGRDRQPDLEVLRRDAARGAERQGGGAERGVAEARRRLCVRTWAGWPRDRVIVVVVDADGRLDPRSPPMSRRHFREPTVGGVQLLVRIYNRVASADLVPGRRVLRLGLLYQARHERRGAAGMGGNGQFNRLSALDDVVDRRTGDRGATD